MAGRLAAEVLDAVEALVPAMEIITPRYTTVPGGTPGQALADFAIFKAVAEAWGCGDLFRRWRDPETGAEAIVGMFPRAQSEPEGEPAE